VSTEATQRPWRQVDRGPAYDWNSWHFIQSVEDGRRIGRANYEDAALIVEAVNNYDELRAALLHVTMRRHEHSDGCDGCLTVQRMVRAALREKP